MTTTFFKRLWGKFRVIGRIRVLNAHAYKHTSHWPALVDVVDSQRAHAEDEENGDEHVVDGPDVVDLKQFTDEEEETQRQNL